MFIEIFGRNISNYRIKHIEFLYKITRLLQRNFHCQSMISQIKKAIALPKQDRYPPNYDGYLVIGAGLPRTGTLSMATALEILLKGPSYHMKQVMDGGEIEQNHWKKVFSGQVTDNDWKEFLEGRGFRSGVDYPISHYFEALMKTYPNAKVVLTIRDPEKWYTSVKDTIFQSRSLIKGSTGIFLKIVGMYDQIMIALGASSQLHPITNKGLFDTIEAGKEESVDFFNTWVQHVKETVPEERLLIFEVKQGWKPLCKFLNLPIPEEPFPNVNDSASMIQKFKLLKYVSFITLYITPGILAMFVLNLIL